MGRQETEGHLRILPKLWKLVLSIAVHNAWDPGQIMSNPSSLEEVPAVSRGTGCLHSHLGPEGQKPGA